MGRSYGFNSPDAKSPGVYELLKWWSFRSWPHENLYDGKKPGGLLGMVVEGEIDDEIILFLECCKKFLRFTVYELV